MAQPFAHQHLTADDYFALPDDGNRYELIDGELELAPAPSADLHQQTIANLFLVLGPHVRQSHLGLVLFAPADIVLSGHDVVQPDIFFVQRNRRDIVGGRIHGAPDLVVEVTSPTSEQFDRGLKLRRYARFGVTWYWLVDPRQRTIEELELTDREYRTRRSWTGNEIFEPALFPGLRIDLTQIWPESDRESEE